MIGSLGDALSGVNLGGGYEPSGVDWGAAPLPAGRPAYTANGSASNQAPPSAGTSTFSNGQRVPSRQNLLFGTDMNDLQEPTTPVRKESIELFLSQSPSQTLGQEVLQLQQTLNENQGAAPNNNHRLNGWNEQVRATGASMAPPKGDDGHGGRRKIDSPSVTGTSASSRSASPSAALFGTNTGGDRNPNKIQAFHGRNTLNPPQGVNAHGQLVGMGGQAMLHPSGPGMMPDVNNPAMHQMPNPNHTLQMNQAAMDPQYMLQPPQQPPPQVAAPPPQVLYMAVPTPDGRGQMLQAVQMVQIPGGAQTYVLPTNAHLPAAGDPGGAPPMMVLPTPSMAPQQSGSSLDSKGGQWNVPPQQYSRNSSDQINNNQYSVDRGGVNGGDYLNANGGNDGGNRSSPNMGANGSDAIASLYSAPQRPPLDALLGHVRRLSRDQVGCRLLQQALDEEGAMAATLILNEGISFWGEAMVDPFGNYLFQKILEKITAEERIVLIKSVSARLVNASLNLHGTRSVQKVVELCASDDAQNPSTRDAADGSAADILTSALSPAAARLCIDSHGNHVIQRILLKLGHQHSRFVFDAVAASVGDVARHRHGCCVIQRCLDSPPSEARSHLVRRIVEKSLELMQDAYGNYVVQYVLDVCGDEDVHAVCESVTGKVCLLAIQKFSSNVMEKCLERCTDRVKEMYLQELSDPERIRELMMDPFGNYVVQRALSVATHTQAIRLVEAMRPHLISSQPGTPHGQRNGGMRNTAGGRRIMAKICRRFPNFTLTAMGSPEELYSQHKGHHHHRKHQHQGQQQQHQPQQHQQPHQQQQHQQNHQPQHHQQQHQQQGVMGYPGMSPGHHQAPQIYGGSPHQGQHVAQANMRQPYFDVGTGYYDHQQANGHPNYHPHM